MNFFESQERARQRTSLLVLYFIFAVAAIISAIYLIFDLVFQMSNMEWAANSIRTMRESYRPGVHLRWDWEMFGAVAAGTILVVFLGSIYKIIALASGGEAIARDLGARQILPSTKDHYERVVLNVVEEMSIASGVRMPPVFVMDQEPGINAFAAGFSPDKAVIGVTRGCIERLNRDELQGVIAHEFSHILNGDMRLNIRLTGVLHGILVIWLLGYWLLRGSTRSSMYSRRSSREGRGGGHVYLLAIAAGLMVVGYIGVFFGRLIKAAVSRQREFLADASAVQFTRNPTGISGALKKIGGFASGSRVQSPNAEEASHFFFAFGLPQGFFNLLSTHPPLAERIRRIDPMFDGKFTVLQAEAGVERPQHAAASGFAGAAEKVSVSPEQIVSSVGKLSPEYLDVARGILATLPAQLREAIHEPYGARAVIYCMLMERNAEVGQEQIRLVAERSEEHVVKQMLHLLPLAYQLPANARLPLVDLSLPALLSMSREQYTHFIDTCKAMIKADAQITVTEYVVYQVIRSRCEEHFFGRKALQVRYKSVERALPLCSELVLALAQHGSNELQAVRGAYENGMTALGTGPAPLVKPEQPVELKRVVDVLDQLAHAAPRVKEKIMLACAACVVHDGLVTVEEGELIRAVGDSIGCPVPPGILVRGG